jgi:hypothetical protein
MGKKVIKIILIILGIYLLVINPILSILFNTIYPIELGVPIKPIDYWRYWFINLGWITLIIAGSGVNSIIKITILEKKGIIRILLFLFDNQNVINSKYQLQKSLKLHINTINNCIAILEDIKIIITLNGIGPRGRTEIRLTKLGMNIAQSLAKINNKLNFVN